MQLFIIDNLHFTRPQNITAMIIDNVSFTEQRKLEQNNDPVIHRAKILVQNGDTIIQGRLKHIQNQLCIENDILTKSG